MNIKEFEALGINAQAELVWQGEFVGTRVVDDVYIQRYKLTSFEVDLYYEPFKNHIEKLEIVKRQAD